MNKCYICYEFFIDNKCNCEKCYIFNDNEVMNIPKNIIIHNNRKYKYNFKCYICNKELCRECYYRISSYKNIIIKCPYCRQPGAKEYFKNNVVRDINTLGFGNFPPEQQHKLEKLSDSYINTWKIGYWNNVGFKLIKKITGVGLR